MIKKHRLEHVSQRRAIIGIESALVLIAFVIVATALAFVVLNTGFDVTQKAKTSITSTLKEAASALEISGSVIGSGHASAGALNVTAIPLRLSPGGNSVNLGEEFTAVQFSTNDVFHSDIYAGTLPGNQESLEEATENAVNNSFIDFNPYIDNNFPSQTAAFVYWTVNDNDNDILDPSEHAILAIVFSQSDRPTFPEDMTIEIITSDGSTLTIERQIPYVSNQVVFLG